MTTSQIPTIKAALYASWTTALAGQAFVSYGHPGTYRADDMVAVMDVQANQRIATMGPNRPRDEAITVGATISCYRGGGLEVQQTVTERAFALLALLEAVTRTDPSYGIALFRLGGVDSIDLVEQAFPDGRLAEVAVTFTGTARI